MKLKQVSLCLPKHQIEWLQGVPDRSQFLRDQLEAAIKVGLRGSRRPRNSTNGSCAQTTLLLDDALMALTRPLREAGELSTLAELVISLAMDKAAKAT